MEWVSSFGLEATFDTRNRSIKNVSHPSCNSEKEWSWIKSMFFQVAIHIKEPLNCSFHLIHFESSTVWAYLFFWIFSHMSPSFSNHLHHVFPPMTWLRIYRYHSLKRPFSFDLQIPSHLSKAHFFPSRVLFQRHFHWMLWTILRMDLGAAKNIYLGIACRTDLKRTRCPTRFRD